MIPEAPSYSTTSISVGQEFGERLSDERSQSTNLHVPQITHLR